MKNSTVGIIGGGLAGLTTAYYLNKANISTTILEARPRLGGRILTLSNSHTQVEMGATWLGKKHTKLLELLNELELDIFEQFMGTHAVYDPISTSPPQLVKMPFNEDPTFRIRGGSSNLIDTLASNIESTRIHLDSVVKEIKSEREGVKVLSENQEYHFDFVVSTLPPKLLHRTLKITPTLPLALTEICDVTHTWMSESIKVALTYAEPFWKSKHPIGSIFSNTGIVTEMYDHCDFKSKKFALKGFINGGYAFTTKEERLQRILTQLVNYFGSKANDYLRYDELIWRNEQFTHYDYDQFILPHQNNGNEVFSIAQFDGRLIIGGSETAKSHPGYMDGAVESGKQSAEQIITAIQG